LKNIDHKVQAHFDQTAGEFDSIYDDSPSFIMGRINRLFRKGMFRRVALPIEACCHGPGTVLDVGCGSGRIALPLAAKGLKVTGIDYAPAMIDLAQSYQKEYEASMGKKLPLEYRCADFMKDISDDRSFDMTVALGLFDYIEDPVPFLKRMGQITRKKIVAAYPALFTLQTPLRKFWLWKRGCPVFFYSRRNVEKLYQASGLDHFTIQKVPAGYFVAAEPSPSSIT